MFCRKVMKKQQKKVYFFFFFLIKYPKYRLLLTLLNWMDGCFCVFKRDCMAFSVDGSARNLSFRYVLGRCSAATTVSRLYDVDA